MSLPAFAGKACVSLEYIDQQRASGWPDIHPEDYCHRCGGRNLSWWIDSPAWNAIMRPLGGAVWFWNEIICPMCFAELLQLRFPRTSFELRADPLTRGGKSFVAALERGAL